MATNSTSQALQYGPIKCEWDKEQVNGAGEGDKDMDGPLRFGYY